MIVPKSRFMPLVRRHVRQLKTVLRDELFGVALFGSVARDEATENSDVDLLTLVHRHSDAIDHRLAMLAVQSRDWQEHSDLMELGVSARIYGHCVTESAIRKNPLILLDIADHGVVLYDPRGRIRSLLARFREKKRELGTRKIIFPDGKWAWDLKPDWKPGEVVEIKL